MKSISPDTVPDTTLLSGIARRDQRSLEQLYDRYAKLLYSVAMRIVRDRVETENILQEVFLQVWRSASTYNACLGTPCVWLIRIARNKSIDLWRSKGNRIRRHQVEIDESPLNDTADPARDPHEIATATQAAVMVREALLQLPQDQRRLIELAYYEGYSQSELAEKLTLPLGTVKSRMRLGLLALREQFASYPELKKVYS